MSTSWERRAKSFIVVCELVERKKVWLTVRAESEKRARAKAEYRVGQLGEYDDYKWLEESAEAFDCEEVADS